MVSVPPEKAEPLVVARGNILRESGEPAAAVKLLAEAVARYPGSFRVRESLAKSLLDLGKVEEAVKALSKPRSDRPGNSALELELQGSLGSRGRSARAGDGRQGSRRRDGRVGFSGPAFATTPGSSRSPRSGLPKA
jgi:predicted Zn-dependent protease